MTTVKELLDKYGVSQELPKKFGEIDLEEMGFDLTGEHHTETQEGKEIHVFTKERNNKIIETIIDLNDYDITMISKEKGAEIGFGLKGIHYDKNLDDVIISNYN